MPTVLIVDDEPFQLSALREVLGEGDRPRVTIRDCGPDFEYIDPGNEVRVSIPFER